jgi:anthranilate phosphoribosyltransferase
MASETIERLISKKDLSRSEAHGLMHSIMRGELENCQIAAVLTALRMKGETVDEIAGFATAMRENALAVKPRRNGLVDTCGTGGDARGTFNVSTAAALVAASMGIAVAKHGNRAVSSSCGSADVLEALGVNIDLGPDKVAELIDRVGIGFLFAPNHHPAMKHAAPVRKQLGIRTVFNLLGPLTNPAGVRRQLLGVFSPDLTELFCRVLYALGAEKAFVVHGHDGTDEVSLSAETRVSRLDGSGAVRSFTFSPEEAGIERAELDAITGSTPEENAGHIESILRGGNGARSDAVLLNAGFVAALADRARGPAEGVCLAREAIRTGRAWKLLEALRKESQALANKAEDPEQQQEEPR